MAAVLRKADVPGKYTLCDNFVRGIHEVAELCRLDVHITALSPPVLAQCPITSRVRADRPTSATDRSAHETSVLSSFPSTTRRGKTTVFSRNSG